MTRMQNCMNVGGRRGGSAAGTAAVPGPAQMLPTERNYAFRRRMDTVHKPCRRDPAARPTPDDVCVNGEWRIGVCAGCSPVILYAAQDLQDYFRTSMGVDVRLIRRPAAALARQRSCICLLYTSPSPRDGLLSRMPSSA